MSNPCKGSQPSNEPDGPLNINLNSPADIRRIGEVIATYLTTNEDVSSLCIIVDENDLSSARLYIAPFVKV
jgi:hypothetical protein